MSDPVISLTQVHDIATRILRAHDVSAEQARAVADTVTAAERDECKSHGLFRIPGYLKSVTSGKVDGQAVPKIHDVRPGVVHVDAKMGFAPLALEVGAEPLAQKARAQGIAALAITDCHHFAALWPETERLAEQGLVAFAFTGSNSFVAPAGGTMPLFGTNPMAFAWPRENAPPVVFDQASSASARGEIQLHLRDGHSIPHGWAIDAQGHPTNDPGAALKGAQLPFGGYKGGAIALMVELLAGALIGDLLSFETSARDNGDGGPPTGGEFMIAIDPAATRVGAGGSAAAHAESLFARILDQDGTRLPSDRRYSARARTATTGVSVARVLHDELQALLNTPS
jgi:delta1-piperideine-2-carboxylate reductase